MDNSSWSFGWEAISAIVSILAFAGFIIIERHKLIEWLTTIREWLTTNEDSLSTAGLLIAGYLIPFAILLWVLEKNIVHIIVANILGVCVGIIISGWITIWDDGLKKGMAQLGMIVKVGIYIGALLGMGMFILFGCNLFV